MKKIKIILLSIVALTHSASFIYKKNMLVNKSNYTFKATTSLMVKYPKTGWERVGTLEWGFTNDINGMMNVAKPNFIVPNQMNSNFYFTIVSQFLSR